MCLHNEFLLPSNANSSPNPMISFQQTLIALFHTIALTRATSQPTNRLTSTFRLPNNNHLSKSTQQRDFSFAAQPHSPSQSRQASLVSSHPTSSAITASAWNTSIRRIISLGIKRPIFASSMEILSSGMLQISRAVWRHATASSCPSRRHRDRRDMWWCIKLMLFPFWWSSVIVMTGFKSQRHTKHIPLLNLLDTFILHLDGESRIPNWELHAFESILFVTQRPSWIHTQSWRKCFLHQHILPRHNHPDHLQHPLSNMGISHRIILWSCVGDRGIRC